MKNKQEILLKSGTNELEIVEFFIDFKLEDGTKSTSCYGVNVGKVREIIKTPKTITPIAKSHPAVEGMFNFRGKIIPIVNIPKWLGKNLMDMPFSRVIITEFNKAYSGFLVSAVSRIHRISWKNIEPPCNVVDEDASCITGIVKFEDRILMMLDFEMVFADINPSTAITGKKIVASKDNSSKTILLAEDSNVVKTMLKRTMDQAGYKIIIASDGQEAYYKLLDIVEEAKNKKVSVFSLIHLVITDVEMPRMDGLHLLKKIREHDILHTLPVIVFSSMATKENIIKWSTLGATDHLSKPEIDLLMSKIQKNIL